VTTSEAEPATTEPLFRALPGGGPAPTVSTGHLPRAQRVQALLDDGHRRYRDVDEGTVADYIPALAAARPEWFGACIAATSGQLFTVGDATRPFTIQSVSKVFTFALVCEAIGPEPARERLGVNGTGLPFDSVMAVELNGDRTMNPLVNAGALAATSLVPGRDAAARWSTIVEALSRFAGRRLALDDATYQSESAANQRNRGLAQLLDGYGRMYSDPVAATDLYTRQCSLLVDARDLAVMGATLADGGVNPVTGERVVTAATARHVLAVLATAGLYERSGDWLYEVGLPGKSGVSGGIVTVAPGKGGLGSFSPPLDRAGNSVRGQLLTKYLSERLGLNLFASSPAPNAAAGVTPSG
jgi:glutaminase